MPAANEHAKRVKDGLAFLSDPNTSKYPNEMVIAYFYVCLHMFEGAVYDFLPQRHFNNHGDRTRFFNSIAFETTHPMFGLGTEYEALRGISESARYLSPAGINQYEPLKLPRDLQHAQQFHGEIRRRLEVLYSDRKKPCPWQ